MPAGAANSRLPGPSRVAWEQLQGQSVAGSFAVNEEQAAPGAPATTWLAFVSSSDFVVDVAENQQSEFLQIILFIFATIWLIQRGSPESKRPGQSEDADLTSFVVVRQRSRLPAGWRHPPRCRSESHHRVRLRAPTECLQGSRPHPVPRGGSSQSAIRVVSCRFGRAARRGVGRDGLAPCGLLLGKSDVVARRTPVVGVLARAFRGL